MHDRRENSRSSTNMGAPGFDFETWDSTTLPQARSAFVVLSAAKDRGDRISSSTGPRKVRMPQSSSPQTANQRFNSRVLAFPPTPNVTNTVAKLKADGHATAYHST